MCYSAEVRPLLRYTVFLIYVPSFIAICPISVGLDPLFALKRVCGLHNPFCNPFRSTGSKYVMLQLA